MRCPRCLREPIPEEIITVKEMIAGNTAGQEWLAGKCAQEGVEALCLKCFHALIDVYYAELERE